MTSSLARRLERLEEETPPQGETRVFQIVFVSPDGTKKEGPRFEIPAYPASGWRYVNRFRRYR
jgi:hypothetical protein